MDKEIQELLDAGFEVEDVNPADVEWGGDKPSATAPDDDDWGGEAKPVVSTSEKFTVSASDNKSDQVDKSIAGIGYFYGTDVRRSMGVFSRDDGANWEPVRGNESLLLQGEINMKVGLAKPDKKGNRTVVQFLPSRELVKAGIARGMDAYKFDPFLEYLEGLPGKALTKEDVEGFNTSADTFILNIYPDTEDSKYTRSGTRNIIISAVARALNPDAKRI